MQGYNEKRSYLNLYFSFLSLYNFCSNQLASHKLRKSRVEMRDSWQHWNDGTVRSLVKFFANVYDLLIGTSVGEKTHTKGSRVNVWMYTGMNGIGIWKRVYDVMIHRRAQVRASMCKSLQVNSFFRTCSKISRRENYKSSLYVCEHMRVDGNTRKLSNRYSEQFQLLQALSAYPWIWLISSKIARIVWDQRKTLMIMNETSFLLTNSFSPPIHSLADCPGPLCRF